MESESESESESGTSQSAGTHLASYQGTFVADRDGGHPSL
jgi:hypothetical protein